MNNSKFKKGLTGSQKALKGFQKQVMNIGGTIAAAFSVNAIANFTKEAVQLSAQMEGVEAAFRGLGQPGLLNELRTATRNTVTDLQLMQKAVQAKNFKIPLEQLATYFEFATNRAIQTGESVDYLVDSIITGIGRKSVLVMDNLGISAAELQEEVKKVGDFGLAAGNIIERSLQEAGDVASTTATQIAQITTAWQNFKTSVGDSEVIMFFLRGVKAGVEDITRLLNRNSGPAAQAFADFYATIEDKKPEEQIEALKSKSEELNNAVRAGAEKRMALNRSIYEYEGRFQKQKERDVKFRIEAIDAEQDEQLALRDIINEQIKALEKLGKAGEDAASKLPKVKDITDGLSMFNQGGQENYTGGKIFGLDWTRDPSAHTPLGPGGAATGGTFIDALIPGWEEGWEEAGNTAFEKLETIKTPVQELGSLVGMSLVSQFDQLGYAIGQFASGAEGAFRSLGDAIMQNLGNILIMMGAQTGNIPLLLAGIGLQLGGGILRGLGNKGVNASSATSGRGEVMFRLQGKDLVGAIDRYNYNNGMNT